MWRKEDGRPQNPNEISTGSGSSNPSPASPALKNSAPASTTSSNAVACLSQGMRIKGEIVGREDLFIDGNVEGKITFQNSVLTVGPNATVKADITAREIVVRGRVNGKLEGSERVQIWNTGRVNGDIHAERVVIEEGAEIHGKMEAGKAPAAARSSEAFSANKTEPVKAKETVSEADKTSPGAAVAGAD
jgi:cytoskeletal protein CcmA (bactofilin family)